MRDPENIGGILESQPDYLGLIFHEKSPRFVGKEPDEGIIKALQKYPSKTGVFVNKSVAEVLQTADVWGLNAIQLHGQESPAYCLEIKKTGKTILKAFSISEKFDFDTLQAYSGCCDYFLFDTKGKLPGGTGKKFNWVLLEKYTMNTPFFLSGGISPEDIEDIRDFKHPQLAGLDINSGFETGPAMKDVEKAKEFIRLIRNMNDTL